MSSRRLSMDRLDLATKKVKHFKRTRTTIKVFETILMRPLPRVLIVRHRPQLFLLLVILQESSKL